MMRSAVDLPQPDGPSRLTNSPRADVEVDAVRARPCRWQKRLADAAQRDERRADRRAGRGCDFADAHGARLRPQIEADALVDELQRVGLLVVDAGLTTPALAPSCRRSSSCARRSWRRCRASSASPESTMPYSFILAIEKAICSSVISGLSLLDQRVGGLVVAVEIVVPADDRGIDEALHEVGLLRRPGRGASRSSSNRCRSRGRRAGRPSA